MGLKDTLQAVVQELADTGALPNNTLNLVGALAQVRTVPPAIAFVIKGGNGGGVNAAITRSQQNSLGEIKRPLHTRYVGFEAHIWAGVQGNDDYTAAEDLLNRFLSALHHQAYGCYTFDNEQWLHEGSDATNLGRRVIVHCTLQIPIYEVQANAAPQPPSSVTVTKATQTDQMNNTTSETVG